MCLFVEMDDLRLSGRGVRDFQAYARLYLVQPLPAGGSGINVQHIAERSNALDPQYVAVTADEYAGRILREVVCHCAAPLSGPPPDVGHPESEAFELDAQVLLRARPYRRPVDVAVDGLHGRDLFKPIEDLRRTEVSCMQDEIYVAEILLQGRMKVRVRIGENAEGQNEMGYRSMSRTPSCIRASSPPSGAHCFSGTLKNGMT